MHDSYFIKFLLENCILLNQTINLKTARKTEACDHALDCSQCKLRELCLTGAMTDEELSDIGKLVEKRIRINRGEKIFNRGDTFDALFAVRTGFFKTSMLAAGGREQVTGFQMAGELLGMDGVANDEHQVDAVALEDSEVCVLPYHELEHMSRQSSPLQRQLHRVMSREIVHDHSIMMVLGGMKADARVAAFLLNLSKRFESRGYDPNHFQLRATREEIGSYLGLTLETVSRAFKKLQSEGHIAVAGKDIELKNSEALVELYSTC